MEDSKEAQLSFNEFLGSDFEAWKKAATDSLKGQDFEKALYWQLDEGFSFPPYFDQSHLQDKAYLAGLALPPDSNPALGARSWEYLDKIPVANEKDANHIALHSLMNGANGVIFDLRKIGKPDWDKLLKDIYLEHCNVSFVTDYRAVTELREYQDYILKRGLAAEQIRGHMSFDPLRYWALSGKRDMKCYSIFSNILEESAKLPNFRCLVVHGNHFHDSGADAVQEIAFSLAAAVAYIDHLSAERVPIQLIMENIVFKMAMGSNYFLEIAKLRALRMLFTQIAWSYGVDHWKPADLNIHARNSLWNKSIFDSYNNILRCTLEAMSAVLGGANSLDIMAFNGTFKSADRFGYRIARNISNLLREESYLDKYADPVEGSYYIENLSHELAERAWRLFQQVEEKGGYEVAFETGWIVKEIEKSKDKKIAAFRSRKKTIIGTNRYVNVMEKMDPDSFTDQDELKKDANGLLHPQRAGHEFESLRLNTEKFVKKHGRSSRPQYVNLLIDKDAMSRARSAFAVDFFSTAGFALESEKIIGIKPEELPNLKAPIICICGSDEDYEKSKMVNLIKRLREKFPQAVLILAGNPKEKIEELGDAGIDTFIHRQSDIIEILSHLQQKLLTKKETTHEA